METKYQANYGEPYPSKIFAHQLITIDDLARFKQELLSELLSLLKTHAGTIPKKWMKSHEVRRFLKISPGTLQTLKSSGVIPYTKIGGVHFYDQEDILKLLESSKVNGLNKLRPC